MSHHLKDNSRHCKDRSPIRRPAIDSSEHHSSLNQVCAGRSQDQGSRNQYQGNRNQYQENRNQDQGKRRQCQGSRSQDQGSKRQEQKSRGQDQGDRSQDQGGRSQDNSEYRFCIYCGNDIWNNPDESILYDGGYHGECITTHIPRCDKAVADFRDTSSANPIVLRMGIHVALVNGQEKSDKNRQKTKRANKITELLEVVSAVRNSDSGYIFIHLVGLAPGDKFTGFFDEFVDAKLNDLIKDGSTFADVYKKTRLSDEEKFKDIHDILVLFVKGADFLETADFKTKSALDDCIIDTPDLTLLKFIKNRKEFEENYHTIPVSIPCDLNQLQERRDIQTKAYFGKHNNAEEFLSILDQLRLSEYITVFSKLEKGGSYLLGIAEKTLVTQLKYKSKIFYIKPACIKDFEAVKKCIEKYVSENVLVCDYDGEVKANTDLIQVFFIPASDKTPPSADDYVIHVSVRPVSGIVFYDKDGPTAYKIDPKTNSIDRLSFKEWFRIFKQRIQTGRD